MHRAVFKALLLFNVEIALSLISIVKNERMIYETAPTIYIEGSGFDDFDSRHIYMTLSVQSMAHLNVNKNFEMRRYDGGVALVLNSGR